MSANEFNLPPEWDSEKRLVALEWYDNFRARRIHEVLDLEASATVPKSLDLQDDAVSMAARDILRLLAACGEAVELGTRSTDVEKLLAWNGAVDNEAREAAFYSFWIRRFLKPAVLEIVGGEKVEGMNIDVSLEAVIEELRGMDEATRNGILVATLVQSDQAFAQRPFVARRVLFRHAIQDDVVPGLCFSAKPAVWSGDETTVRLGKSGYNPDIIEFGASFRIVIDIANWDNSRWSNVPDQTAHSAGNAVSEPLLYSPEQIKAASESVTVLTAKN
jgi:penicillin amidase